MPEPPNTISGFGPAAQEWSMDRADGPTYTLVAPVGMTYVWGDVNRMYRGGPRAVVLTQGWFDCYEAIGPRQKSVRFPGA